MAQLRILRNFWQRQPLEDAFDVQAGAAAQYRHFPEGCYVVICCAVVAQVFVKVVFVSGRAYVYEMDRDIAIFLKVLSGSEVHAAVHLTGVGTYDLSVDRACKLYGPPGLARGCRSGYDYK